MRVLREVDTAIEALASAADGFNLRREAALQKNDEQALAVINRQALGFERAFLSTDGIPGRPWYRHLVYAPKFTYAPELLPGVSEAVDAQAWSRATEQARALSGAVRRAATVLREE
jgi:N-acetylated-alpha-linked acidic dipeptidase